MRCSAPSSGGVSSATEVDGCKLRRRDGARSVVGTLPRVCPGWLVRYVVIEPSFQPRQKSSSVSAGRRAFCANGYLTKTPVCPVAADAEGLPGAVVAEREERCALARFFRRPGV